MNNQMTRQQNIDKILAEIDKVCPERKELTFGCVISIKSSELGLPSYQDSELIVMEYDKGGKSFDGETTEYYGDSMQAFFPDYGRFYTWGDSAEATEDMPIYVILGHPPTLAMVLAAVKKVGYGSTEEWLRVLGVVTDKWNLHKDSLYDQSDETVEFIASLLP